MKNIKRQLNIERRNVAMMCLEKVESTAWNFLDKDAFTLPILKP